MPVTAIQGKDYDEESAGNDSSLGRGTSTGGDEEELSNEQELRDAIIEREEINVRRAKLGVVCALLACAAAVSVAVHIFAKQNDQHNFDIEVNNIDDTWLSCACDTPSHMSLFTVRGLYRAPC